MVSIRVRSSIAMLLSSPLSLTKWTVGMATTSSAPRCVESPVTSTRTSRTVPVTVVGQERSPTINIGGVFGGGEGDKVNTVPARARFSIDRRVLPIETVAQAEEELRQALARAAAGLRGVRVAVHTRLRLDPCLVEPEGELPRAFARAVQSVRRRTASFGATRGFTDLHYFVAEAGLPGIGYGVKGEQGHGVDERVGVRDLLQTSRVYAEFMRRGLRAG